MGMDSGGVLCVRDLGVVGGGDQFYSGVLVLIIKISIEQNISLWNTTIR